MSALTASLTSDAHAAAPADSEAREPAEAHRLASNIAAMIRTSPMAWWAEDAHVVLTAIASRMAEHNKTFGPHQRAVEALDDCADILDGLVTREAQ